eukprot:9589408-Lingulodinium_polyedra.AAC.1
MEQQSKTWSPNHTISEITQEDLERLEGSGAATISTQEVENMSPTEQAVWVNAMEMELGSLDKRE